MANFYTDSHGGHWGVMMQEKKQSCGPACVAMTKVYYTSSISEGLEAETRRISQNYPGKFTETGGTLITNLVSVLQQEGVKTYKALQVGNVWNYIYGYTKEETPLIVAISWPGGGGHASVCANVYKSDNLCIFLDPFYGLVQIFGSNLPQYKIQDPTGTYPPVAIGTLSGWIVVTRR